MPLPHLVKTQYHGHTPSEGPSCLGGDQLQVANRFGISEELDLLHQVSPRGVAVPARHSLVEEPCGCGETEKAEIVSPHP